MTSQVVEKVMMEAVRMSFQLMKVEYMRLSAYEKMIMKNRKALQEKKEGIMLCFKVVILLDTK